jgi:hypothetical protein
MRQCANYPTRQKKAASEVFPEAACADTERLSVCISNPVQLRRRRFNAISGSFVSFDFQFRIHVHEIKMFKNGIVG